MASSLLAKMEMRPVPDMETDAAPLVEAPMRNPQKLRLLVGAICVAALVSATAIKTFGSAQLAGSASGISADATPTSYGCSNWDSIQIAYYAGKSRQECLDECGKFNKNSGANLCQAVNYQPDAVCTGEKGSPGSCFLFRYGCQKEPNDCFEFYDYTQETVSTKKTVSDEVPTCKQEGTAHMLTNTPCKCGTSVCGRPLFEEPPMTCDPNAGAGKECAPMNCPTTTSGGKQEAINEQGGYPCKCGDRNCTATESGLPQYCDTITLDGRTIGSCLPVKCIADGSVTTKIDIDKSALPCLCDDTDVCETFTAPPAPSPYSAWVMHCVSDLSKGSKCVPGAASGL